MNFTSRAKRFTITYIYTLIASAVLVTTFALAFGVPTTQAQGEDYGIKNTAERAGLPAGNVEPTGVAAAAINIILGLVGIIAVVLILYGGFTWMTSAGNEEKIEESKKLITSVVIGLAIVLSAYIITSFVVKNLKTATTVQSTP